MFKPCNYSHLQKTWPPEGRVILATYDPETVVVYQAYNSAIAEYAVEHQRFGGTFSYDRMSWIKTNFLWMMYRCGWATKRDQERVLAVTIKKPVFEDFLGSSVASHFDKRRFGSEEEWKSAAEGSDIRLQWDPDHDPFGAKCERRAIQIGMRGQALRKYGTEAISQIDDITEFVAEQRYVLAQKGIAELEIPCESVYPLPAAIANHIGADDLR